MPEKLRVLFLSPEAVPFAKTGGLADVAGSLPGGLARLGVVVRQVLPLYDMVRKSNAPMKLIIEKLTVPLGNEVLAARVWESKRPGKVPVYFVEREDLYARPHLYGDAFGDYYDNLERFSFYCHAALRIAEKLSFAPHLIHCHDWQSGLIPPLIRGPYSSSSMVGQAKTIFTIHNIGYQGICPVEKLWLTGLRKEDCFRLDGLEFWGKVSLLKAGIVYADAITTVSPTYARQIQTGEYGMGMEGILHYRRDKLHGILNGVDYTIWNPEQDKHLAVQYSLKEMSGKNDCKNELIRELHLDKSLKTKPLLGMVSRLDAQKGLDLLVAILDDVLALDVGMVILGSGDDTVQKALEETARKSPGRVGIAIGFDEPLAHRIMAGADIFLIPSRYEPCGLTQMYALKYGTIPVVRATGGLDDTITPFNPQTGKGNGFKFAGYSPEAFLSSVREAVGLFYDTVSWRRLVTTAMGENFSWRRSSSRYFDLYRSTLGNTNSHV